MLQQDKMKKLSYNSPVILTFVALSFIALIANELTHGTSNSLLFTTYHSSLTSVMTYVRFFTHVLGHSSWAHYTGNMVYILLLGPLLEEKYKSLRMIEVIAATALTTGLVNYFFFPSVVLCGASGVCFAFILLSSFTSFRKKEIPLTFILVAVFFIGQQIIDGIMIVDNISNLSHIIGGIIGAVFGFYITKRVK